jgi:hypothetical protein
MNPHRRISAAEALRHPYFTAPGTPPPPPPHTCVAPAAAAGGGQWGVVAGWCSDRGRVWWPLGRLYASGLVCGWQKGEGGATSGETGGRQQEAAASRIVSELGAPVRSLTSLASCPPFDCLLRFTPTPPRALMMTMRAACRSSRWLPATSWRCATPTTRHARRRALAAAPVAARKGSRSRTTAQQRQRRSPPPRCQLTSRRPRASASSARATAATQRLQRRDCLTGTTSRTPSGAPLQQQSATTCCQLPPRRRSRSGQRRWRRRTAAARRHPRRRQQLPPPPACGWAPQAAAVA